MRQIAAATIAMVLATTGFACSPEEPTNDRADGGAPDSGGDGSADTGTPWDAVSGPDVRTYDEKLKAAQETDRRNHDELNPVRGRHLTRRCTLPLPDHWCNTECRGITRDCRGGSWKVARVGHDWAPVFECMTYFSCPPD